MSTRRGTRIISTAVSHRDFFFNAVAANRDRQQIVVSIDKLRYLLRGL